MMKMPNLGLGTFRLKDQPLRDSLLQGLDLGYRHIDTAQIYDNEAEVGRLMNESGVPRQDIYLTTKVWISEFGPGKVIPSLELSLEKLGTDYLDLTLIHWPSPKGAVPVAEFMGASQGLGAVVIAAQGMMDTTLMFAALVLIAAMGLLLYQACLVLERYLLRSHHFSTSQSGDRA